MDFEKLKQSKPFLALELFIFIWSFVSIGILVLNAFGIGPTEISFVKKSEIQPLVHLYPGSNVQFKPEFNRIVSQGDITGLVWTLSGKGKETDFDGLEPVITLPPEGGIYDLSVYAKVRDSEVMRGATSIYIVQVKPQTVTAVENLKIKVAEVPIEAESIEIYQGEGKTSDARVENTREGSFVNVVKGQELRAVSGRVFYKVKSQMEPASAQSGDGFKTFSLPAGMATDLKN